MSGFQTSVRPFASHHLHLTNLQRFKLPVQAGIDRYRSPEPIIAQAILAILLPNATATTLCGLRASKSVAHFFGPLASFRLKRNAA